MRVLASLCYASLTVKAVQSLSSSGNPAPLFNAFPAPDGGSGPPAPEDEYSFGPRPSPSFDSPAPGSTEEPLTLGCTDVTACNYDSAAGVDNDSCTYAEKARNCDGSCANNTEEDCKGVCGGSSVCCPQTCTNGMSCDEIGQLLDEDTDETCVTLEASGCDCSGCGCGVIVDVDGYEVPDGMESSGLTCDKSAKLTDGAQPCTASNSCTASECKDYCTAADDCSYAGSNTQGGCILYTNCKTTRTVSTVTTTYHKVDDGSGVVDDGNSCFCTWWTCANDDDLGYCP